MSKRHVLKYGVQVPGILRTVNGKKMEMVVKEMISTSLEEEDVVNPEAVDYFRRFRDWEGDEEEVPSKEKSKL